ncbi:vestitone reductase-like [Panicum miliaceum]|uniref:Vestitone reductase-like n=1 Tax=Panicum miliaceum TaxID=4540 RepID=A0A3L6PH98_PANMI|nr:vestitone reductase-like [Panicum miliaceum]
MVSGYRITQESQGLGRLPLASLLAARFPADAPRGAGDRDPLPALWLFLFGVDGDVGWDAAPAPVVHAHRWRPQRLEKRRRNWGSTPGGRGAGKGGLSLPGPRAPCPPSVSRGDVAFVLALPGVHVPVLYYALMAVGAVMSPANPALTAGEISGLVTLSGPSVAFAVKATAGKLPRGEGRTPPCGAGAAAPPRAGAGRPALRGAVAGALLLRVSSPGHVGRAYALRLAGRDFSANPFREAAMAEEQRSSGVRVCVTGGAGFIGSWLVKKLLERGYTVHATLRNTGDEKKAGMLRRLVPGAAKRLRLFDADLFDAATFAPAIAGCQFVFLLATPFGLQAAGNKESDIFLSLSLSNVS